MIQIFKKLSVAAALALILGFATSSLASVNIQVHRPGSSWKYTVTENAVGEYPEIENASSLRYTLLANYDFVGNPLVETDRPRETRYANLVTSLSTLDLMAQLDFNGVFAINAAMPLHVIAQSGTSSQFAPGDARVFGKIYLNPRSRGGLNFALIPEIFLPTGDKTRFLSDGTVGFGALLAAEIDFSSWALAGNVGYRAAQDATFRDIDYRERIPLNIGAFVPVAPKWALTVEARRDVVIPLNRYQNPSELYGGARYEISHDTVVATAGAGFGSFGGATSVDYRVLAGLKIRFAPKKEILVTVTEQTIDTTPMVAAAPEEPPVAVFTPVAIDINQEVKFLEASDVLLPKSKLLLNEVAKVIKQNEGAFRKIKIEGHTNYVGGDAYNLKLSKRRAIAVKQYLSTQGVDKQELDVAYFGKRKPKPETLKMSKADQRIINRRVEFHVIH